MERGGGGPWSHLDLTVHFLSLAMPHEIVNSDSKMSLIFSSFIYLHVTVQLQALMNFCQNYHTKL